MILHTVNKSPLSHNCLQQCLASCGKQDAVLLIEDGAYGVRTLDQVSPPAGLKLFVLQADLDTRGIKGDLDARITAISDQAFVTLVTEYDKVVSWY